MNVELQKCEIRTNVPHTFSFTKPVKQFMVGFSSINIFYDRPDHHLKLLSFDLSNAVQNGNDVTVTPQLKLNDNSNHHQSSSCVATVIVIANVGEGNPNLNLYTNVEVNNQISWPSTPLYFKSGLVSGFSEYSGSDHHLFDYSTTIRPSIGSSGFYLAGESYIRDKGHQSKLSEGKGKVIGNAISYNSDDKKALFADFDSMKDGEIPTVCLGDAPADFYYGDFDVGVFISSFDVSFTNFDHHILQVRVAASMTEELNLDSGKVYAKLSLESYLVDNGNHPTKIPHNSVSGFVVAIRTKE